MDSDDDDFRTVKLMIEDNGRLKLNEEALETVLDSRKLGKLPIAVISIAGAFRMGKSFLLNFFLRYFQKKGWQSKDGSWLKGWSSSEDRGIKWKGGAEGDTRGILALKDPIIVKKSNGKKIAVILVDTQGNFEHGRSREENVGIFALSTLFSSLQIFNVSKQLQTNDLEYLQCFVEFSKLASPKSRRNADSWAAGHQRCFFQELLFLVRDWQNPISHPYGITGGKKYLKSFSSSTDAQIHNYLDSTFSKVQCFLMPEPSDKVRIAEAERQVLRAQDIGTVFSEHLNQLVNKCIHPDVLQPKTLGFAGQVTADMLLHHVKCCVNKILCGDGPEFPSLMKLLASNANRKALEDVLKTFAAEVKREISQMEDPTWEIFDELMKNGEGAAKKILLHRTSFGGEDHQAQILGDFRDRIQSAKSEMERVMQKRRLLAIQSQIKEWKKETIRKLQFMELPFTDVSLLEGIRDQCRDLLPIRHPKDSDSVTVALIKAKDDLDDLYRESVRCAETHNSNITLALAGISFAAFWFGGTPIQLLALIVGLPSVFLGVRERCNRRRRREDTRDESGPAPQRRRTE